MLYTTNTNVGATKTLEVSWTVFLEQIQKINLQHSLSKALRIEKNILGMLSKIMC